MTSNIGCVGCGRRRDTGGMICTVCMATLREIFGIKPCDLGPGMKKQVPAKYHELNRL